MASEHGHTPAAWTAVAIMFVGVIVGAVAVVIANIPMLFAGLGVVALGVLTGWVMAMMGLGQKPVTRPGSRHHEVASS